MYLRICLCTSTDVLNDDNTSMLLLHTIMLHVCTYVYVCVATSTDVLNDDNTSMLLLHTIMLHVCTYVYVCVHLLMY